MDTGDQVSDTDQRPTECDGCNFPATDLLECNGMPGGEFETEKRYYCALCHGTATSVASEFPDLFENAIVNILRTINFNGNSIIAAIERAGKRTPSIVQNIVVNE